jgi:hypothetical protein
MQKTLIYKEQDSFSSFTIIPMGDNILLYLGVFGCHGFCVFWGLLVWAFLYRNPASLSKV